MIGHFICRCCGENAVPAFADAHACVRCWARWEEAVSRLVGEPVSGSPWPSRSLTGSPADSLTGKEVAA